MRVFLAECKYPPRFPDGGAGGNLACEEATGSGQFVWFGGRLTPEARSSIQTDVLTACCSRIARRGISLRTGCSAVAQPHPAVQRASQVEFEELLGPQVEPMDLFIGYFCRVTEETEGDLERSSAIEREVARDCVRVLFSPYASVVRDECPLPVRPYCGRPALGILSTLSRMVGDKPRVESGPLSFFDAFFGYLLKYSVPTPKATQTSPP